MAHDTEAGATESFATGGCACGAIRYRLADVPYVVHCCHCTDCQRESGSAFAVNAAIESTRFFADGAQPLVDHLKSASGAGQVVVRCPDCHTTLWSHYGGLGDKATFVRVGTLDNPALCPPSVHLFARSKLDWVVLDQATPAYAEFYSGRDVPRVLGENGAARLRALRAG